MTVFNSFEDTIYYNYSMSAYFEDSLKMQSYNASFKLYRYCELDTIFTLSPRNDISYV